MSKLFFWKRKKKNPENQVAYNPLIDMYVKKLRESKEQIELLRIQSERNKDINQGMVEAYRVRLMYAQNELKRIHDFYASFREANIEDRFKCCICYDLIKDVFLLPCKNWCVCHMCAESLKQCPICRKTIEERKKIFLS